MSDIFNTPIGNMYGPHFLLLYLGLIIIVLLFLRSWGSRLAGKSAYDGDNLSIPLQPDPYEIAYLNGRERDVLVLCLFSMIERGYLYTLVNDDKSQVWIRKKTSTPSVNALNELEKKVLNAISESEKSILDILTPKFSEEFTASCRHLRERLEGQGLINRHTEANKFQSIKTISVSFLLLVGLYKLIAAHLHGHSNVFFLIALMVLGSLLAANIQMAIPKEIRQYIKQYEMVFHPVKNAGFQQQPFYMKQLQLAIYGSSVLLPTSYAYLSSYFESTIYNTNKTFMKSPAFARDNQWFNINMQTSTSGGSCGSSCSSGCGGSCGGGCGGGCGGCGG